MKINQLYSISCGTKDVYPPSRRGVWPNASTYLAIITFNIILNFGIREFVVYITLWVLGWPPPSGQSI